MKQTLLKLSALALLIAPLALAATAEAATPNWNTSGSYVIDMHYLGTDNNHDMVLTQGPLGALAGHGGSPVGANVYTWVITSGTVSGDTVDFLANYTATADAVTPQTVLHITGTIAPNGTLTGTWSDNYQGGTRTGALTTVSGAATKDGVLAAEDFGVVNYDTGLGMLKGYSAGFGLTSASFLGAQSVVVKLYNGNTLLQTNTGTPKLATLTGSQISSPFDVSGTFNYVTDGYWVNTREVQYGQSVPATRVVATVTLANGKVVTAENTVVSGDPTTIYLVVTPPVVKPTTKNQCKDNGWKSFTSPTFKNQGQCVSYVEHLGKDKDHDKDDSEHHDSDKKDMKSHKSD